MQYGAHLPLIDFVGASPSLADLTAYTGVAQRLGYTHLCANDHLLFPRPWLDGPTALAASLGAAGEMTLATTVALPVVRGPFATAKQLTTLDRLSGGRLIVGVGPGSSPRDYAAVGLPFDERWRRFDEAIRVLRAVWRGDTLRAGAEFYHTEGIMLEPLPLQRPSPPIWIGSWGSPAGLRRVARLGDGWLASAYNTTPTLFARAHALLAEHLVAVGKDPAAFPNAIATMWMYVTESESEATRMLEDVLRRAVDRPLDELRERALIGSAAACAEKLSAYARAGVQRLFVWPLADELQQLTLFREKVTSLVFTTA